MKNWTFPAFVAAFLAVIGTVSSSPARGQGGPTQGIAAQNVAYVDIGFLLEHHPRFQRQREAMKVEMEALKFEYRQKNQGLENLNDRLNQFRPGTEEYQRIREEIATTSAQAESTMQMKLQDFERQENALIFETYQEIVAVVSQFSRQYGIDVVERIDSKEIDPNDRDSIQRGMMRRVVFQQRGNITYQIQEIINTRHQVARPVQSPR